MGLEMVNCCGNGLSGQTLVECRFGLLSALPSVTVHVVVAQVVVVDADGLPVAILKGEQDNRVALNRPSGLAEPNENPSTISISIVRS
jgi:hypothetical protein